jgi:hypothetical protein
MSQVRPCGCGGVSLRSDDVSAKAAVNSPCHGFTGGVSGHSNRVVPAPTIVLIYWDQYFTNTPAAVTSMNQFVTDLATGNYWSGLGQYGVGAATLAGHVVIDMKAWPTPNSQNAGKAFSEAQMQSQLTTWLDKGVVSPQPAGAEQNLVYLIVAPSDTTLSLGSLTSGFCGYHQHGKYNASGSRDNLFWGTVQGYSKSTSGQSFVDSISYCVSHELTEAFSNPDGGGYFNDSNGCELGDICEAGATGGIVTVPYKTWKVETYWSNVDGRCISGPTQWSGELALGGSALMIAAGQNADGRIEIFYVGTNNALYHNWQTAVNGTTWAGETRFPNDSAKQIAVARNADGRLEIFYVGSNNALYHNWQTSPNGAWAGETRFANDSAKWVAVGRNADGRLEIFYVGTNDGLYHNWQTKAGANTWAGETRFPNDSAKMIAVGQNADGRLEVFYVGTNNFLYHNWQTKANATTWAGETRFPNASAQWVAVGQNADGHLEIFYVGTNNALYHNWQSAPNSTVWAGETQFPNDSAQYIAADRNPDGRQEIFYVGTNTDLYRNWQTAANGVWAGEFRLSGATARQIAIGRNQDGRLEVFYVGTNGNIYHNRQTVIPSDV